MSKLLPKANYRVTLYKKRTVSFGALDKRASAPEGSIASSVNLELTHFPVLAPRQKSGILKSFGSKRVYGFGISEKPFYCASKSDGTAAFYYDDEECFPVSATYKSFAVVSGRICIFPDKLYFSETAQNAKNKTAPYENLEALYEAKKNDSSVQAGDIYIAGGAVYSYNPSGLWCENLTRDYDSVKTPYLYLSQSKWNYISQCFGSLEAEINIGTKEDNCVVIEQDEYGKYNTVPDFDSGEKMQGICVGDVVCLRVKYRTLEKPYRSVCTEYSAVLSAVNVKNRLYSYVFSGVEIMPYLDDGGNPATTGTYACHNIEIVKKVPDFEVVFSHDNRLWGAHDNTIYASALGDPGSFSSYSASASSPWSLAFASSGKFTGGCSFLGYPTFFKEDLIVRIAGSYPAKYSSYVTESVCGIKVGEGKSLTEENGALYYTANGGIARYTGSYPTIISAPLGETEFSDTAAGAAMGRVYFSIGGALYIFDTKKGAWICSHPSAFSDFAFSEGVLYALSEEDNSVLSLCGENHLPKEAGPVYSEAVTSPIYADTLNQKGLGRISVLLELSKGAHVDLYISCDGKPFKSVAHISESGVHRIPAVIKRCREYRIKIKGTGFYKLCAIEAIYYKGSDL